MNTAEKIAEANATVRAALLAERNAAGHWTGELSTSALSTATAVCALATVAHQTGDTHYDAHIQKGLKWLAAHANPDGGWGDTTRSFSNISTTTLGWAAFGSVKGADEQYRTTVTAAEKWLTQKAGGVSTDKLVPAIIQRYGKDRTFSVPILTMCAIAGRLGVGKAAWKHVLPLPFELAALPAKFYAAAKLPVVSYALPALIAIGQVRHDRLPTRNPITRYLRDKTRAKTLEVLTNIQPPNGGFLEATPLTSFVTMSLAAAGLPKHIVAKRGVEFLCASMRPDGSWPIDTNLATWVTTLAISGLSAGGHLNLSSTEREQLLTWLLDQQYRTVHPYTNAAPGGWAWTNLPGGVPDADDTPGALLALHHLGIESPRVTEAATAGCQWLLGLQNSDGGIPTFCRGWGTLPFDRSSQDLTAHTLRAWHVWEKKLPAELNKKVNRGIRNALHYLCDTQRNDGSWLPLWFGNQHAPDDENPAYGTAKVVLALSELSARLSNDDIQALERGVEWIALHQKPDGSWSGAKDGPSSIEETALCVEALAAALTSGKLTKPSVLPETILAGANWLAREIHQGHHREARPIGFYFAKLWYYEKLYPLVFSAGALERVMGLVKAGKI
ncbi:MAG TPA: prenyltransferase/squalene oxidase repeat-containing protein [Verrucomicrobiae bacterium]